MIVITDIHGNFLTLQALLKQIPQGERDKGIVIAGDLIDRGPRSREVVQWAIDNNIPCVLGNHEAMMIERALSENLGIWGINGGYECLASYEKMMYIEDVDYTGNYTLSDIDTMEKQDDTVNHYTVLNRDLIKDHIQWMSKLPLYLEFPTTKNKDGRHLVVSHSVITNSWKDHDTSDSSRQYWFKESVIWGRPSNIKDVPEIYNVIGHTPQKDGPRIRSNYANIDTGCFYKKPGYGKLTALSFPSMQIWEQENVD